ncbi:hypothetical protein GOP47_0016131, partial [Adiantum capillus-veneris]
MHLPLQPRQHRLSALGVNSSPHAASPATHLLLLTALPRALLGQASGSPWRLYPALLSLRPSVCTSKMVRPCAMAAPCLQRYSSALLLRLLLCPCLLVFSPLCSPLHGSLCTSWANSHLQPPSSSGATFSLLSQVVDSPFHASSSGGPSGPSLVQLLPP